MEYVLPKDISNKFGISIQTVYNYLTKFEWKIRLKKEFSKTFINLEDFTNILQPALQPFKTGVENTHTVADFPDIENFKKDFQKLESDYSIVIQRTEDLEKYNVNLQEQLSRYAIMLTEEKNEKKEILTKHEATQKEFLEKVESLFREKSLFERRYFLLLGFVILLIIFIARTILPQARSSLQ